MKILRQRIKNFINEPQYISNAKKLLNSKINKITIHSDIGDYDWVLEDKFQRDVINELIELFIEIKSK